MRPHRIKAASAVPVSFIPTPPWSNCEVRAVASKPRLSRLEWRRLIPAGFLIEAEPAMPVDVVLDLIERQFDVRIRAVRFVPPRLASRCNASRPDRAIAAKRSRPSHLLHAPVRCDLKSIVG